MKSFWATNNFDIVPADLPRGRLFLQGASAADEIVMCLNGGGMLLANTF